MGWFLLLDRGPIAPFPHGVKAKWGGLRERHLRGEIAIIACPVPTPFLSPSSLLIVTDAPSTSSTMEHHFEANAERGKECANFVAWRRFTTEYRQGRKDRMTSKRLFWSCLHRPWEPPLPSKGESRPLVRPRDLTAFDNFFSSRVLHDEVAESQCELNLLLDLIGRIRLLPEELCREVLSHLPVRVTTVPLARLMIEGACLWWALSLRADSSEPVAGEGEMVSGGQLFRAEAWAMDLVTYGGQEGERSQRWELYTELCRELSPLHGRMVAAYKDRLVLSFQTRGYRIPRNRNPSFFRNTCSNTTRRGAT